MNNVLGQEIGSHIILSPSCNKTSEFDYQENGILRHIESDLCIEYTYIDGKLKLNNCSKAFKFYGDDQRSYGMSGFYTFYLRQYLYDTHKW